jgi:hypothetical protein
MKLLRNEPASLLRGAGSYERLGVWRARPARYFTYPIAIHKRRNTNEARWIKGIIANPSIIGSPQVGSCPNRARDADSALVFAPIDFAKVFFDCVYENISLLVVCASEKGISHRSLKPIEHIPKLRVQNKILSRQLAVL